MLRFTNEWLRKRILSDPEDDPIAGLDFTTTCTRPSPHDGPCNGLPCEYIQGLYNLDEFGNNREERLNKLEGRGPHSVRLLAERGLLIRDTCHAVVIIERDDAPKPLIEIWVEDDELWHYKHCFDAAWLEGLIKSLQAARDCT